jgi:hypothetical protein
MITFRPWTWLKPCTFIRQLLSIQKCLMTKWHSNIKVTSLTDAILNRYTTMRRHHVRNYTTPSLNWVEHAQNICCHFWTRLFRYILLSRWFILFQIQMWRQYFDWTMTNNKYIHTQTIKQMKPPITITSILISGWQKHHTTYIWMITGGASKSTQTHKISPNDTTSSGQFHTERNNKQNNLSSKCEQANCSRALGTWFRY